MGDRTKKTIWLVDSEDHLARLLHLKLASRWTSVVQLKADQQGREIKTNPHPRQTDVVLVSLPQPGRSSSELLAWLKKIFHANKIIFLTPLGMKFPANTAPVGNSFFFTKPVDSWESIIDIILD